MIIVNFRRELQQQQKKERTKITLYNNIWVRMVLHLIVILHFYGFLLIVMKVFFNNLDICVRCGICINYISINCISHHIQIIDSCKVLK